MVLAVERDTLKQRPPPPFTTASLQHEAAWRLCLSIAETMDAAQRLYEGVDLAGETAGLITYMRTDSAVMAKTAVAGTRAEIRKRFTGRHVHAVEGSRIAVIRCRAAELNDGHFGDRESLVMDGVSGVLEAGRMRGGREAWARSRVGVRSGRHVVTRAWRRFPVRLCRAELNAVVSLASIRPDRTLSLHRSGIGALGGLKDSVTVLSARDGPDDFGGFYRLRVRFQSFLRGRSQTSFFGLS